jgi:hypothetical protein
MKIPMTRLPPWLLGLAALCFVLGCGGEEATLEDTIAALCARTDACVKTQNQEACSGGPRLRR